LELRVAALARPKSNSRSKLQTHTLIREGAPYQENHNCQTKNKNFIMCSRGEPDTKTDWPPDHQSCNLTSTSSAPVQQLLQDITTAAPAAVVVVIKLQEHITSDKCRQFQNSLQNGVSG
jgi:hypothetical protein